jgi:multisubunit Na+/H+ antiporter MnhB subunit
MDVVVPLIIALATLVIILAFYKLMFKQEEEKSAAMKYLIWGIVGIMLVMSAKYLSTIIYERILQS